MEPILYAFKLAWNIFWTLVFVIAVIVGWHLTHLPNPTGEQLDIIGVCVIIVGFMCFRWIMIDCARCLQRFLRGPML